MNLISCNSCGVILDKDKLIFPDIYEHDSGDIIEGNSIWDGQDYVAVLPCPVCKKDIKEGIEP